MSRLDRILRPDRSDGGGEMTRRQARRAFFTTGIGDQPSTARPQKRQAQPIVPINGERSSAQDAPIATRRPTPRSQAEAHGEAVTYTFCDTTAQVELAITELSQYDYVCLDCEGQDFGHAGGALSLLCMGTPNAGHDQSIFLFDVLTLVGNEHAIGALRLFLANQGITKVAIDGRSDYLEIWDTLGVEMLPVLDLQVAEALALSPGLAIQRLFTFGAKFVSKNKELFQGMRRVVGMDEAMRLYVPKSSIHKDETITAMHKRNETYRWMERPLPSHMLLYAASDVRAIACLLDAFRSRQIIPGEGQSTLRKLKSKSERYVTRNGSYARPTSKALDQFSVFTGDRTLFFPAALSGPLPSLFVCRICSSKLPLECYQVFEGQRRVECRACVAWTGAPKLGKRTRMTVEAPPRHHVPFDWVEI